MTRQAALRRAAVALGAVTALVALSAHPAYAATPTEVTRYVKDVSTRFNGHGFRADSCDSNSINLLRLSTPYRSLNYGAQDGRLCGDRFGGLAKLTFRTEAFYGDSAGFPRWSNAYEELFLSYLPTPSSVPINCNTLRIRTGLRDIVTSTFSTRWNGTRQRATISANCAGRLLVAEMEWTEGWSAS